MGARRKEAKKDFEKDKKRGTTIMSELSIQHLVICPKDGEQKDIENECCMCSFEGYATSITYHCRFEEKEKDKN